MPALTADQKHAQAETLKEVMRKLEEALHLSLELEHAEEPSDG